MLVAFYLKMLSGHIEKRTRIPNIKIVGRRHDAAAAFVLDLESRSAGMSGFAPHPKGKMR